MSRLEVRYPELTVIELDDSFEPITHTGRVRVISDGVRAISVLGPGKQRRRLIEDYPQRQPKPNPKVEVVVLPKARATAPMEPTANEDVPIIPADTASVDDGGEPWVPDYRDWYSARLKFAVSDKYFIVGELEDGSEVWIPERDISRCPAHSLCLPINTPLSVRLELNVANHRFRYHALECQIDGEPATPHALGVIAHWRGSLGNARIKPCGCNIFVMTRSQYDQLDLSPGDGIEFDIELSNKTNKYIGVNVRPR